MTKPPIFNAAHTLDRSAWMYPERVNLVYRDRQWTVADSALATRRLAQLFAQAGVARGDRVLMVAHNSPYHLLTYIACARIGAIFVPVSHRVTRTELQEIVEFCAPRVIIADAELAARGSFVSTGTMMHFVIDDDSASGPLAPALEGGFFALSAALGVLDGSLIADSDEEGAQQLNQQGYPGGAAALLFTAGSSSGSLRAVELTHENLWWAARNVREALHYHISDSLLVATSFANIGGFNGGAIDLFVSGGRVIVMRDFVAAEVLRSIGELGVSIFFGVPTMYRMMLDCPDLPSSNLSSLRIATIGGAQVSPELIAALTAAGIAVTNVWGVTEVSGPGILQFPGRGAPGAIGRPLAYLEARVVDPGTREESTDGELLVRGPAVTPGYWHNDDANASSFTDGWLHTGDLVRVTDELEIIGRLIPRISSGGEGVDPREVEGVLRQYPGIDDVVVVGLPDPLWDETVVAAIVCDDELVPALADIQAFVGQFLSRYKLPRRLARLASIPHDEYGYVDRNAIRAELIAMAAEEN